MGKWEQKTCRRPLRHGASGWVWRIPLLLLLWSWLNADYRCQEKFVALARATVTRTPAERTSIQQLLQEHEKSFFSWRREQWRKHPGVKKIYIYCKESFWWKWWKCCTKSKLLECFSCFSSSKKLQARFWKEVGVAMRGRPAWRWRAAAFYGSQALVEKEEVELFCFPFTSHSLNTTFSLLLPLHYSYFVILKFQASFQQIIHFPSDNTNWLIQIDHWKKSKVIQTYKGYKAIVLNHYKCIVDLIWRTWWYISPHAVYFSCPWEKVCKNMLKRWPAVCFVSCI